MDQDSSNGGGERRNWRERLGIAKEPPKASSQPLPKLANEFKGEPAAPAPRAEPRLAAAPARPSAAPARPAAASGQPGAPVRPAPMAPRPGQPVRPGAAPAAPPRPAPAQATRQAPAQTAARPPAPAAARPVASQPAQPAPAAPRAPAAPNPAGSPANDEFADRLRKQREAAEKLAQQRAEARAQQLAAGVTPGAAPPATAQPGEKPRFTFAPEELEQGPPLSAAPAVTQPVSRPQGQWAPGYPPLPAPPAGGYQRPSTAYPYGQPYNAQGRPAAARPGAYPPEGWARPGAAPGVYTPAYQPPEPPGADPDAELRGEDVPYPDHMRPAPRPRPPAPAQRRLPPPAEDDVFEAEAEARPTRRQPAARAGRARDLAAPQRSYTEYDEEFDEAPRRRGPLWLLLGLLAVALLAGAMLWMYYQYAGRTAGGQTGEIPVIAPAEQPVKATPDPATAPQQQGGSVTQPQGRKQIYDRILGDDTVEPARVVPTEEQPVPPQPPPPPAATAPQGDEIIEPAPVAPPIPGQQGGTGQPEPLPLPPPPGQQGSLPPPPVAPTVQAAAAPVVGESVEQIAQSTTGAAGTPAAAIVEEAPAPAPPPKKKAKAPEPEPDTEAIVSAEPPAPPVQSGSVQTGALSPPVAGQAVNDPLPLPPAPEVPAAQQPAPAQQQGGLTGLISQIGSQFGAGGATDVSAAPAATQPRKRSVRDDDPLEGTRVPLNASGASVAAAPQQEQQVALNLPPAPEQPAQYEAPVPAEAVDQQAFAPQAPAPQAPAPAPAQQGGFLQNLQRNLGLGGTTRQPATVVTGGQQAANQQVAALPPASATAPAPAPAVAAGGGFQVQLASFTSQGEAESEFQRLKQRHPGLLGNLQPRIQAADLGSLGTRYRLGVAPLGSREQAAKLCNSLIAAGVRDCTVRGL